MARDREAINTEHINSRRSPDSLPGNKREKTTPRITAFTVAFTVQELPAATSR